ncbi:MAG: HDOD domain-containing protein [Desulfuromonadaceae bacterium]|nr:HDOD domain-containing protein [Desulfuromonadaceae bacterium]
MVNQTCQTLRVLKEIPPPRGLSQEVIRVVTDERVDLVDLVNVINKSPAIAAKILRCANSAYYGQRREISTVREAVIRVLGLGITRSLSLAIALSSNFDPEKVIGFDEKRYWFNAVTSAVIAQELCYVLSVREKPAPAVAYTAGLIHNIGLQALIHCFPQQMQTVFANSEGTLAERIRGAIGLDHHQASFILAENWGLPEIICHALVWGDNTPEEDPTASQVLATITRLSSGIADELYTKRRCDLRDCPVQTTLVAPDQVLKIAHDIELQLDSLLEMAQLISRGSE